ncbi:hypothetical protein LTR10_023974 [Elasticomyces elasticus]|nr:hypothetical protein LTR10_023974 [Elasticomyces elasticus]
MDVSNCYMTYMTPLYSALILNGSGFAGGIATAFRSFGGSVGTAMYIALFQSQVPKKVPLAVATSAAQHGVPQKSIPAIAKYLITEKGTPLTEIPGITSTFLQTAVQVVRQGYIEPFKLVWFVSVAFGGLTLLCALALKDANPQDGAHG